MASATRHESVLGVLAGLLPRLSPTYPPTSVGQGMQREALCLQLDGHVRDPRGTAAFQPTLRLGTQGEGRTEASDGGARRTPGVDPRPRRKHQHPLAPDAGSRPQR
jgi:hypothetical protein